MIRTEKQAGKRNLSQERRACEGGRFRRREKTTCVGSRNERKGQFKTGPAVSSKEKGG